MYNYLSLDKSEGGRPIAKIRTKTKNKDDEEIRKPLKLKQQERLKKCLFINSSDKPLETMPKTFEITSEKVLKPLMIRADNEGHANRVFIAGGTLSGKSYLAAKLAKDYQLQFPKNKVILFSWVDDDKNYKDINNLHKIRIDESILDEPISLDELHDSLCIFDDCEHFTDKAIVAELERLRNCCFNAGRHKNIDTICVRQNLLDGHKTKTILNSAFQVVGFPRGAGRYQLGQWLKRHMFMDKQTIDKILNVPSRWVLINKNPPYILHQKGCFMLN